MDRKLNNSSPTHDHHDDFFPKEVDISVPSGLTDLDKRLIDIEKRAIKINDLELRQSQLENENLLLKKYLSDNNSSNNFLKDKLLKLIQILSVFINPNIDPNQNDNRSNLINQISNIYNELSFYFDNNTYSNK